MSAPITAPDPVSAKGDGVNVSSPQPGAFTPLATIDSRRENNFDFLRFLLASLVVIAHSYALSVQDYRRYEPLCRFTRGQMDFGSFAVDLFFVISGFLITQSWQRSKGAGDYLKKRAQRIYPGFLVVVLIGTLLVGPLGASNLPAYWQTLNLKSFYYVAQFVPPPLPEKPLVFTELVFPNAIDGSLWSIRYEFWCYLMVLGFGLIGLFRWRSVILTLLLLVFTGFMIQTYGHYQILHSHEVRFIGAPDYYPRLVTYFLTGMLFYLYRERIPRSSWLLAGAVAALLATSLWGHHLELVFPLCGAYVLFYVAFRAELPLHNFAKYGDLSYGIYLYHFPIIQLLQHFAHGGLAPLTVFALAFPLTCLCAALSWHLVEKPFLKKKRS
jgi:peptidoglycan/LPS O-acetylase OafA/YrhL